MLLFNLHAEKRTATAFANPFCELPYGTSDDYESIFPGQYALMHICFGVSTLTLHSKRKSNQSDHFVTRRWKIAALQFCAFTNDVDKFLAAEVEKQNCQGFTDIGL